jgi:hypothetical protein
MTKQFISLEDKFPEVAAKYNRKLNTRDISTIAPSSGFRVWWDCDKGHSWYNTVSSITLSGQGCSVCRGFQVWKGFNDLEFRFPDVAKSWDYNKNELTPDQVAHGTHTKFWWKCQVGHSWEASAFGRTNGGNNCPYCGGKKILKGYNDFPTLHPIIAKEWDYSKNTKDPSTLGGKSHYVAYWRCPKGHSYDAAIKRRTLAKMQCPVCSNMRVLAGYNDIATTHPHLLKEWDYEKNLVLPTEVIAGSNKSYWWKCQKAGHEWKTKLIYRTISLANCPECGNANTSLVEKMFRAALINSTELTNPSKDPVKLPSSLNVGGIVTVDGTAELKDGTKVIFEFDGEYWHGTRSPNKNAIQQDIDKTNEFLSKGYMVIRVREKPLANLDIKHPMLIQVSYKKSHGHKYIPDTIREIDTLLGENNDRT